MTKVLKATVISTETDVAMAGLMVFDAYDPAYNAIIDTYGFRVAAETAAIEHNKTFTYDDVEYTIIEEEGAITILDQNGDNFAEVSEIIVNPIRFRNFPFSSNSRVWFVMRSYPGLIDLSIRTAMVIPRIIICGA